MTNGLMGVSGCNAFVVEAVRGLAANRQFNLIQVPFIRERSFGKKIDDSFLRRITRSSANEFGQREVHIGLIVVKISL